MRHTRNSAWNPHPKKHTFYVNMALCIPSMGILLSTSHLLPQHSSVMSSWRHGWSLALVSRMASQGLSQLSSPCPVVWRIRSLEVVANGSMYRHIWLVGVMMERAWEKLWKDEIEILNNLWGVPNHDDPSLMSSRHGIVTCAQIVAKVQGIINPANRSCVFFLGGFSPAKKHTVNGWNPTF